MEALTRRELVMTAAATAAAPFVLPARASAAGEGAGAFRAGACAVDVMPKTWPVLVSGGFLEAKATGPAGTLHARCLVLDDGTTKVALAIVDTLMMTREFCDEAKELASKATGIPASHILISAVHTHSAPSVMGALGTGVQEDYVPVLRDGIVQGIAQAAKNLAPARVGWTVADAHEWTNCRRWILRPDRIGTDPFGQRNIRAMMHPGYQSPNHVGPSGPIDPDLTLLAVQSPDGKPIAVLANFSMHYFGAAAVSSDYFGIFCARLATMLGAETLEPPFVALMSQGTAGDLHWMDYSQPKKNIGLQQYAEAVARVAAEAHKKIEYRDSATLAACEKKLTLGRRTPDEKRLEWAKAILAKMQGPVPRSQQEVYAKEAIYLHQEPTRELKLQAIRVGDLGITAIPCEVFGITGLKLKAQSPLQPTMNIELANGAEGYIPPPEQHTLGGYTTWPARTAGLEVQAEPKIVETVLQCLEEVAGKPRRKLAVTNGPYAQAILASKPLAYWRMEEMVGPTAADAAGNCPATYEDCIALYLEGRVGRCPHFAGGRLKAAINGLGPAYTVEFWFWNGLPTDAREVTGYLFSRGSDGDKEARGDHLGIGGKKDAQGKLIFFNGNIAQELLTGSTDIALRTWHHVALVRDGRKVTVYLDGKQEISGEAAVTTPDGCETIFLGGRNDNIANFAGKLDEVAVFPRALSAEEIAKHFAAARGVR
ncbi:MAG TPA: LamG domain-containing protein [Planctomycetota bacterium]|nr:LamG domain-containing protein [Planctomycetota bacterium]HRR79141.1 LamG domain-containing protein [Planctomycetota bacterium]HRT97292.1 LamG domain-containing protein [Planctomycetota bacterium]